MSVFDSFSVLSKGKKIAISGIAAVVVIGIIVAVVMIINSGVFSSSMKVLRADGTVNIEDTKGNIKPAKSNMAFRSGDIISTSYDGTAYIGLDNDKTVTLEGYSRASFSKKGKQLELNLITGGLFFEVKNHLNDDESYSIKTTNMSLDIRGTSGYVFYDDTGLQSLIVTDGCVTVEVLNPSSGQRKSAEIHGGQKVTVYLYNMAAGSNNSIKFVVADLRPEDMPEFPLRVLAANKNLLNKVCQYTSWDVEEVQYYINKLPGMNGNPTPTPVLVVQTNTPLPTPTPDPEPTEAPVTPGVTQTVTPTPSSNNDDDDRQTNNNNNNNNNSAPKPTNTPKPTAWATPAPTNTPVPTPTNTPTPIPTPSDVPPTPTSEETSEETEPSEETESTEQSQEPEDPTEPEIPEPNEPEGGDN